MNNRTIENAVYLTHDQPVVSTSRWKKTWDGYYHVVVGKLTLLNKPRGSYPKRPGKGRQGNRY